MVGPTVRRFSGQRGLLLTSMDGIIGSGRYDYPVYNTLTYNAL